MQKRSLVPEALLKRVRAQHTAQVAARLKADLQPVHDEIQRLEQEQLRLKKADKEELAQVSGNVCVFCHVPRPLTIFLRLWTDRSGCTSRCGPKSGKTAQSHRLIEERGDNSCSWTKCRPQKQQRDDRRLCLFRSACRREGVGDVHCQGRTGATIC